MPYSLFILLLIQCQKSTGQSNGSLTNSATITPRTASTLTLSTSPTTASNSSVAPLVNETFENTTVAKVPTTKAVFEPIVSVWSEWKCTRNCSDTNKIRKRTCLSGTDKEGCILPLEEVKPADCHAKICPLDCYIRKFGQDCQFSCEHCDTECDKFEGNCSKCRGSYDYPETGCQINRTNFEDWSPWKCAEDCKNPHYVRVRNCKRNQDNKFVAGCSDPVYDTKQGNCFIGKTCPKDCEEYKWGVNCTGTCVNCMKPCNKFTGICESCRPGFQTPELYCSEPCFVNQYGLDCRGNCFDKCGEDCVERVSGSCRETSTSSFYLFYLLLLIIPISIFIYFVMQRKQVLDVALTKSATCQKVTKSKVTLVLEASKSMQSLKGNKSDKSLRDSAMSLRSLKSQAGVEAGQSLASSKAALPVEKESDMVVAEL